MEIQASVTALDDAAAILPIERALIGMVIRDGAETIPPLSPAEFLLDRHRVIWRVLLDLAEGTELPQVAHELAQRGQLEEAGGAAHLAVCFEEAGLWVHAKDYARRIREAARKREVRRLGAEMQAKGLSPAEIEARLAEIPGPMAEAVTTVGEVWEQVKANWGKPKVFALSGLIAIDKIQDGIPEGDILVVAGRTSHGKTGFLCHLAVQIAAQGLTVNFLSLEETDQSIVRRMVSCRTGQVQYNRLRMGTDLIQPELEEAEKAVAYLDGLPMRITTLSTLRTLDEEHVCGAVAASQGKVVIVDHLQKVSTRGDSRVYGLERVMNRLHAIALRDRKIVILAVQINRGIEGENRPPRLSDLRDSGAIEIVARSIWLLYWPWRNDRTKPHDHYEVYVEKHADGGTGKAELIFQPHVASFADLPAVIDQHAQAQVTPPPPEPEQTEVPF